MSGDAWAATIELSTYLRPGPGPHGDPSVGWPALLDAADAHRLQPALWSALVGRGARPLPSALVARTDAPLAVLQRAHEANAARVADLRAQLELVLDALDVGGIDAIPLKGAHWLLCDWLPDPAARVVVDLDVLVPASLATDAVAALTSVGYRPVAGPEVDADLGDHQLPPMVLDGRAGSVELHVAPFRRRRRALLEGDEVRAAAVEVVAGGAVRRVPAPHHALVLLAGHAQLQDADSWLLRLPLRALVDLTTLHAGGRVTDDWSATWRDVEACFAAAGAGAAAALDGFAAAAHALLGVDLPHGEIGARWVRSVRWAAGHPAPADLARQLACLPQAVRPARMAALYGPGAASGLGLAAARARHLGRGAARRVRR